MKNKQLFSRIAALLLICWSFFQVRIYACTIVSGVACNGHVWNANNEDGPFGVANFLNVFPKQDNTKYGYFTLSYISPVFGTGGQIQGGMNEAGLTFDFAAIEPMNKSELENKKLFPFGDEAILAHLLANMSSTKEIVNFFETYWFEKGFRSAQMHVADKNGVFAIISPSGTEIIDNGEPLVTTNFDICGKEDNSTCWRYPIAKSLLSQQGVNLSTMMTLCKNTAQKTGGTMYSNIQNLTTGDIWFFSKHDTGIIVNTNIKDLLSIGERSYTFSDLRSFVSENSPQSWVEPKPIELAKAVVRQYAGTYENWYVGEIKISATENAINMTSHFAPSETLLAKSQNGFFIPNAQIAIEFTVDEEGNKHTLHFFENGNWSFSADKKLE